MKRRPGPSCICFATAALLALLLAGCHTTQRQQLYFAAVDTNKPQDPPVKFYRLTIEATSTNNRSEFAAGYYDARALREFTGGTPEGSAEAAKRAGSSANPGETVYEIDPATGRVTITPPDTLYAIFYGSHADAMSSAVAQFAKNEDLGTNLGRLLGAAVYGNRYVEAQQVDALEAQIRAENEATKQLLTNLVARLKANPKDAAAVDEASTQVAKRLADALKISAADRPDLNSPSGLRTFIKIALERLHAQP